LERPPSGLSWSLWVIPLIERSRDNRMGGDARCSRRHSPRSSKIVAAENVSASAALRQQGEVRDARAALPLIQHRYKLSISSRTAASGSLSTNHRSSVSNMDRNADFLIVLMSIPFSAFSAAAALQTMSIKRSAP
jgi:hypothetical protein